MSETAEKTATSEGSFTDMAPLVRRVRELVDPRDGEIQCHQVEDFDVTAFAEETGFAPRRQGKPELVMGSDVAVELGHPSTASQAFVLATTQTDLVRHRHVTRLGPDLDEVDTSTRLPLGQVVFVALRDSSVSDPFELDGAQFLINRLPGYMVRSIPGRLWVRISKDGRASGLTLTTVAKALIAAYETDFDEVESVEVFFITSSTADVEALAPIGMEASVIAGRHKNLFLSPDGELECSELTCESCDEKPVCDDLRDVLRERRRNR